MIICSKECIPCCDFCIHVIHGTLDKNFTTSPIGCGFHDDNRHQEEAWACGACNDFKCISAKEDTWILMNLEDWRIDL